MVDKALYVGTSGAQNVMSEMSIVTNNLANSSTTGFRADFETMKQLPIGQDSKHTRVYGAADRSYSDFTPGPTIMTGRDLDVSLSGNGFIAVQSKTGEEGYTRAGDLKIEDDLLKTQSGDLVLSTSGVIRMPEDVQRMSIGTDGTISALIKGQSTPITLNRIKLTNPKLSELKKGTDGLLYSTTGTPSKQDDSIRIASGSLEGSNVNPVENLTTLIELSRRFEMNMNMMKTFQDNAAKANQLLNLG